ncbi:jg22159, partial [Pararge aegeria aegeria]
MEIEYVEEYIYLGEIVSTTDAISKKIERRTTNAWNRYWMFKEVMKSKDMPMKYKQKVFDMCILPILTYGSQTWALTQKLEQKLAICQRSMERSMLHVKRLDKIRNESLRKETNITDVKVKIRKLKWKWAGHVCRQKQD